MALGIIWDLDDDPDGNVQHIAQHGISKEEAEEVLDNPASRAISDSSGRPAVFGSTQTGKHVIVVFDQIDPDTVRPVTAYEVPERS